MENKMIAEFTNLSSRLLRSYETLKQIDEVAIATSPKTAV